MTYFHGAVFNNGKHFRGFALFSDAMLTRTDIEAGTNIIPLIHSEPRSQIEGIVAVNYMSKIQKIRDDLIFVWSGQVLLAKIVANCISDLDAADSTLNAHDIFLSIKDRFGEEYIKGLIFAIITNRNGIFNYYLWQCQRESREGITVFKGGSGVNYTENVEMFNEGYNIRGNSIGQPVDPASLYISDMKKELLNLVIAEGFLDFFHVFGFGGFYEWITVEHNAFVRKPIAFYCISFEENGNYAVPRIVRAVYQPHQTIACSASIQFLSGADTVDIPKGYIIHNLLKHEFNVSEVVSNEKSIFEIFDDDAEVHILLGYYKDKFRGGITNNKPPINFQEVRKTVAKWRESGQAPISEDVDFYHEVLSADTKSRLQAEVFDW